MGFELIFSHTFPARQLDITLSGDAGITALFGPSGVGKTSILRAVLGLLRPGKGRFQLQDRVLLDTARGTNIAPHKRRIGAVFQDGRLFPHLTVMQNIRFSKRYMSNRQALMAENTLVELLGLEDVLHRYPADLSGGETQRVALARALNAAPDMLVMDEPLAALDGPRKDAIYPYFDRLKSRANLPILYVTHSVDELARLADHVALMADGKILLSGSVSDVLSSPETMPYLGVREAGSILRARVVSSSTLGLTTLETSVGQLEMPLLDAKPGDTVRLRILAQDVILATERPVGLSARNILPAVISDIRLGRGPGAAIVLTLGDQTLLARVTEASRQDLGLEVGQPVFAILKSTAIARPAIDA